MKRTMRVLAAMIAVAAIAGAAPAAAADESFTIRFGLVYVDPTGSSVIEGARNELDRGWGGGFDFEWYFGERVGLEASIATGIDADVDSDGDQIAGISVTPVTVGLNGHFVRTEKIDWFVGVLAGQIFYGDFDYDDGTTTVSTEDSTTYGVQTGVDFGISEDGRWAIHLGAKYLVADLDLDGGGTIDVDPVVVRAMAVFRW